ncbi:ABC transporter permease [Allostella humosa]|nr:ABC transporter substrate-binding protein [Stella humosa]BBK33602.1 ABC transporter permease [Stella humosa]
MKTPVAAALATALLASSAMADISGGIVRLGVLNDQSGIYADFGGRGSVIAAQLAVEDFGGKVLGKPVEIVSADHQNKPDIASVIARDWMDTKGVDAVLELTTSAVALAVQEIAKSKNRAMLVTSASSADLTGKACTKITVHWGFDSYGISSVATKATVASGGDSWFFITGDNAGSHAQEDQARFFLKEANARVLGAVRHPLGTADFASYLLQAQASKAKAIALANAGGDTINALKQAGEFGITQAGQSVVPMLMYISDIHALGLNTAQGLKFATPFYWDRTDETRAWSRRFMERHGGRAPTMVHAGVYTMVTHYLKAVAAGNTDGGEETVAKMKELAVNDALYKNVRIREDGRSLNEMHLVEVKKPAESKGPWDYYKVLATVPGAEAFRPLKAGNCPLVKAD